jgi:tetratricopeptide (TPR) repeat protein
MKKSLKSFITGIVALSSAHLAHAAATTEPITGSKGCLPGESWNLQDAIPEDSADQFKQFLGKKVPTVRGFSEALALRRQAQSPEQKYFAEYWVSRSLYGSKLVHISKEGFTVLASRPVTPSTVGIQLEALSCLAEIHNRFSAVEIPSSVIARIPEYLTAANKAGVPLDPLWDVVTIRALSVLSRQEKLSSAEADKILSWLAGSEIRQNLVKGMFAAQRNDHSTVIQELKKFTTASSRPDSLARYKDTAYLLTARSLYSEGQFEAAINQFKLISKSSNELANSLEELTWAYLMAEQYREAIGTAMNLQAGGLRKTFAPEAPMVMSMAMNEICQFPDSLNAANIFRKNYEKSFKWLDQWRIQGKSENLYKLAVQFLKKQGDTPVRVASEWVRSPVFLANQDEINLLFDEKDSASSLNKWGSKEQNRIGQEILNNLKELKPAFYAARAKLKPGQDLPAKVRSSLQKLKQDVIAFRRMQKAAPIWKAVLANHQKQAPGIERRLAAEIQTDLKARTDRMLGQLEETAENIQLIEVEIYNGASEDIIWQNAHPEYKKMAKELDDDADRSPASKVWDWGRTKVASENDDVEVWEDELGSFKADVVDNCSSKDKYLALKSKRGRSL